MSFQSPDLLELMRDFIMSGKGDAYGISKVDWLPQHAVEEFLYHHGYAAQIVELRQRKGRARDEPRLGLDRLDAEQRRAVVLLMEQRSLTEADAVKWVMEHGEELARARR